MPDKSASKHHPQATRPANVLVVDDDADIREAVSVMLLELGVDILVQPASAAAAGVAANPNKLASSMRVSSTPNILEYFFFIDL